MKINKVNLIFSGTNFLVVFLTTLYSFHKGFINEDSFYLYFFTYAALIIIPATILVFKGKGKTEKDETSSLVSTIVLEVLSYIVVFLGYVSAALVMFLYNI